MSCESPLSAKWVFCLMACKVGNDAKVSHRFFLGWELHVPFSSTVAVYSAVMKAGQEFGIANAGYRAIDSLSIEKGYRHWHMDLRAEDDPLEAGLGFTCKLKSPVDFLGRKALEEKRKQGLKKRIACFTIQEYVQHINHTVFISCLYLSIS